MNNSLKQICGVTFCEFFCSRLILLTLLLTACVWITGPLYDAIDLDQNFFALLASPSAKECYIRIFFTLLSLSCGIGLRAMMLRYRLQNQELSNQQQILRRILDSVPECVKTLDADGRLRYMNPAGLNIIQADSMAQVKNACVYDLIAEEDREDYIALNQRLFQGKSGMMEYDVISLKGERRRVETHVVPLLNREGEIVEHLGVTRDLTGMRRSQKELRQFMEAVEQCASVIFITDAEACITYVNPRFSHVTGYEKEQVLGKNTRLLRSGKHGRAFYQQLWSTITAGQEWRGKMQNRRKNGELYWAMVVISPLRDDKGEITQYLCTQEDVTSSQVLTEQLDHQARHCMLTGLINRYEFEQRLSASMASIVDSSVHHALFFLDVDQFKVINDGCGYLAGDQLLRQIAAQIKSCMGHFDVVSRLGGDEFAVLMEHSPPDEAAKFAEKLRTTIEDGVFGWGDNMYRVTVSIGVVSIDWNSPGAAELMSHADRCCYTAKELGRNRLYIHRDDAEAKQRQDEALWVSRIHEGLSENRFCLFVQDITSLQKAGDRHYEVLIRYRDEDGNMVPPGAFLPPAERFGLSPKIDRWVIRSVCQFLATYPHRALRLSINLSGLSIADDDLLEYVRSQLVEYQIDPAQLCFEITETAAISNLSNAMAFIHEMKEIGCQFALDDFGSGLSSFGYLKNLPVDFLKIDGMFVKDILVDEVDMAMVRSINDIGHLMGKKTIAEFVENQEIANRLADAGVDYGQGYGIARPRSIELLAQEMLAWEPLAETEVAISDICLSEPISGKRGETPPTIGF